MFIVSQSSSGRNNLKKRNLNLVRGKVNWYEKTYRIKAKRNRSDKLENGASHWHWYPKNEDSERFGEQVQTWDRNEGSWTGKNDWCLLWE